MMKLKEIRFKRTSIFNVLLVILVMVGSSTLIAGGIKPVNADNPGQELELKDYLVKGKINIVDFYSDFCPPCVRIAPYLEKLDKKDEGKVVIKLDINRKGKKGIDWGSPLARQYSLQSIPHFKIFDEKGKKIAEGREAFSMVLKYFQDADIK